MNQELNFKLFTGYPMLQTQERLPDNQFRFTIVHNKPIIEGDKICTCNSPLNWGLPNGYILKTEEVNEIKFPQHHKEAVKNYTVLAQLQSFTDEEIQRLNKKN